MNDITEFDSFLRERGRSAPPAELLLKQCVSEYGPMMYMDEDILRTAMSDRGAEEMQICCVYMMTRVSGFEELLKNRKNSTRNDLERFVANALQQTGFSRGRVLELTAAIALSLGIPAPTEKECVPTAPGQAFVVPYSLYEKELSVLEAKYMRHELDKADAAKLRTLAQAGIARAKLLYAAYLSHQSGDEADPEKVFSLLREAYADGDPLAVSALGDYYYRTGAPEKAYECYTALGAGALTKKSRENLIALTKRRTHNRKAFGISMAAAVFLILLTLLIGGAGLPGLLCAAAVLCVSVFGLVRYRKKPYGEHRSMPLYIFLTWFIGTLLTLIFG